MIKRINPVVLTLVYCMVLSACGPAAKGVTSASTPSATLIAKPTSRTPTALPPSPSPSRSKTPTPTATLSLPSQGPYFAYPTLEDQGAFLILIGMNGVGRKKIPLPGDTGDCFPCVISPSGEWLAYWTGNAGDASGPNAPLLKGPFDLQLNLLHIPDGAMRKVTGLLSPYYPDNLNNNVDLERSLLWGIRTAVWSPDSRYLAFVGEMDGASSNLYVLDIANGSIRRLSTGSANIVSDFSNAIQWSPDGKWIVYSRGYSAGEGMTVTFHAARPDGSRQWDFSSETGDFYGWISPSIFLTTEGAPGLGKYGLRANNLDTGAETGIWSCEYDQFAYDPEGSFLVYQSVEDLESGCNHSGLYLKDLASAQVRLLVGGEDHPWFDQIGFLGQADRRFLAHTSPTGTFAVSEAGTMTLINDEDLIPFISPSRQWVAFAGERVRVMDSSGMISDPIGNLQCQSVFWRPDSTGLLLNCNSVLVSVSLPDKINFIVKEIQFDPKEDNLYWQPDSQGFFFKSKSVLSFYSLKDRSSTFIQQIQSVDFFDPVWVAVPE
jgi:hypothetical protein